MAPPTPSRQARKTGQEARHLGFPCKSRNGSENFDRGEPKGEREDGTGFEGDVVSELGRLNDRGMGFGFHRHLYPNSFRMCSGEGFPSIGPSIQDPIDPPTALVPRSLSPGPKGMDRRVSQDSLPSRTHIHKERLGSKPGDKLGWSPGMGVQVGGRERKRDALRPRLWRWRCQSCTCRRRWQTSCWRWKRPCTTRRKPKGKCNWPWNRSETRCVAGTSRRTKRDASKDAKGMQSMGIASPLTFPSCS